MSFLRRHLWAIALLLIGIVLVGCGIQTSSEPEIVATRMNRAATVTPTIVAPASFDLQAGANLYIPNCAPCHGDLGLGDGPTAASISCPVPALAERGEDVTVEAWFGIVRDGKRGEETCIMPPWSNRLSDSQMWDVAAYAFALRDGNAPAPNATEAVAQPLPDTTEEPADSTPVPTEAPTEVPTTEVSSAGGTESTPAATEEPADTAPAATDEAIDVTDTFTLEGTVSNGTSGGTLPTDLILKVRVAALDHNGLPQEIYNAETTMAADGSYSFDNVPLNPNAIASVQTDYAGITQFSQSLIVGDVGDGSYNLPFLIYETTTDPVDIKIETSDVYVDAVTAEGASLILQTFEFVNNSDRIYIGQDNRTVTITLPNDVVNARLEDFAGTADRFEQTQEGTRTIFYDSAPLYPGKNDGILATYNKAYNGSMTVVQAFNYEVQAFSIFLAQDRGLELDGDQFQPTEPRTLNNDVTYNGYTIPAAVPVGTVVQYTVKDGPNTPSSTSTTSGSSSTTSKDDENSFLQDNRNFILGIGILLVVAGGMYMLYDLQKTRILAGQRTTTTSTTSKVNIKGTREELIAQIAVLDEAYEAGNLDEEEYETQRQALKDALRRHFK
ncbi:MAG: c-type cytochrome [Anaerolineae bacterium]|nr:c-type cytochrome [Anaerolineae bacterium]